MRTLTGMYKAVCLDVDTEAQVLRCQVPQIFNDETVTCLDLVGGVAPKPGAMGWVGFEAGYPDHPVWMGTDTFGTGETPVGGIYVTRDYRWLNQVTATDPGNGKIKVNNLDPNLATEVYLSAYDGDNTAFLSAKSLRIGDLLAVYLSGVATTRIEYRVAAALVDNSTWFRVPVVVSVNHGFTTATPGNNAQVKVVVQTADIGPQPPDEVWVGPSTPPSALSELWFDTDQPGGGSVGVLRANVGGLWTDITPAGPIPSGGATGSLLAKKSATDFDSQWITQASMGFVLKTGDTMSGSLTINGSLYVPGGTVAIGDDAYFRDVNVADTIALISNTSTGRGRLAFGTDGNQTTTSSWIAHDTFGFDIHGYPDVYIDGNTVIMRDASYTEVGRFNSSGLNLGAKNVYCEAVHAGWSGIFFGGADLTGFYIDGSSSWIRTRSSYGIWLGSGRFGSDGGLSLGFGGGGNDVGHILDVSGYARITQRIDCGAIATGTCTTGALTTNTIDTRSGNRVTSNGGNSADWGGHAYLAQNGNTNRTGYSIHPGGVAKSIDMMQNNGYINFLDEGGGWYAQLYCLDVTQVSQRRGKQNIASWPPKSAGSAVMGAASRLSLIDVVSYQIKPELMLLQAESLLPGEIERLHDCETDDCDGTPDDPCQRVKEWMNPMIGIIIEDLATVLPEAVGLDPEGKPGGVRTGSMLGYLLAVCKEQQERIEALEQHLQEAA